MISSVVPLKRLVDETFSTACRCACARRGAVFAWYPVIVPVVDRARFRSRCRLDQFRGCLLVRGPHPTGWVFWYFAPAATGKSRIPVTSRAVSLG